MTVLGPSPRGPVVVVMELGMELVLVMLVTEMVLPRRTEPWW